MYFYLFPGSGAPSARSWPSSTFSFELLYYMVEGRRSLCARPFVDNPSSVWTKFQGFLESDTRLKCRQVQSILQSRGMQEWRARANSYLSSKEHREHFCRRGSCKWLLLLLTATVDILCAFSTKQPMNTCAAAAAHWQQRGLYTVKFMLYY